MESESNGSTKQNVLEKHQLKNKKCGSPLCLAYFWQKGRTRKDRGSNNCSFLDTMHDIIMSTFNKGFKKKWMTRPSQGILERQIENTIEWCIIS